MKRTLLITMTVIAVFAAVGGVAFTFGTPQAPDVVATAAAPGAPAVPQAVVADAAETPGVEPAAEQPADTAAAEAPVTEEAQVVPEPDTNAPLAIEIPGCVCHSDDPKLVEEHSEYRMNQCAGCHAGGTPTGME